MHKTIQDIALISGKAFSSSLPAFFRSDTAAAVHAFHKTIPGYQETPLIRLKTLADSLGIGEIFVKDESFRFGLKAFKCLGSSFAIAKLIADKIGLSQPLDFRKITSPEVKQQIKDMVFVTATDGNHGKGVAWSAAAVGCKAFVFMPQGTKACRADAIRSIAGTRVTITDQNYDHTVRIAAAYAKENGYFLVQDTGFPGYEEIPGNITLGYTTMAEEAWEQMHAYGYKLPSHLFLQAGVGSMAGGVLGYFVLKAPEHLPVTTIVEPDTVACFFESARIGDGNPHGIPGNPETIMAGLNCGEPNPFIWPILRDFSSFYAACPDFVTETGMRTLAFPLGQDKKIVSGESGAVSTGLLKLLCTEEALRGYKEALGLKKDSVVLLFSTEGDTDPENYQKILHA